MSAPDAVNNFRRPRRVSTIARGAAQDAAVGGSCFTSVFFACVRMVWNGFAANSGVDRIKGMRMRSS